MKRLTNILLVIILVLAAVGCSQEPAKMHYGSDECAYCKMMITNERFAAQMVTSTGKAVKFDAIECMASYASENKPETESAKFWLSNFVDPGTWVDLQHATIIRSESIKSPMGANLLAVGSEAAAREHLREYPGERVSWEQLVR